MPKNRLSANYIPEETRQRKKLERRRRRRRRRRHRSGIHVSSPRSRCSSVHLLEADVLGILMEALTAHVETVFANQSVSVAAGSATTRPLSVLLGVRIPNVAETHLFVSFFYSSLTERDEF